MTEPDRRVFPDPVLVEVKHDGVWVAGALAEWSRWDGRGWLGYVTYTLSPGETYKRWTLAKRIRPRNG